MSSIEVIKLCGTVGWVDMKIYGINSGDGCELCHPKDESDFGSIATLINGRERRRTWSPIRMRIIKEDERGPLRVGLSVARIIRTHL
jgi:hypothetical protein